MGLSVRTVPPFPRVSKNHVHPANNEPAAALRARSSVHRRLRSLRELPVTRSVRVHLRPCFAVLRLPLLRGRPDGLSPSCAAWGTRRPRARWICTASGGQVSYLPSRGVAFCHCPTCFFSEQVIAALFLCRNGHNEVPVRLLSCVPILRPPPMGHQIFLLHATSQCKYTRSDN